MEEISKLIAIPFQRIRRCIYQGVIRLPGYFSNICFPTKPTKMATLGPILVHMVTHHKSVGKTHHASRENIKGASATRQTGFKTE